MKETIITALISGGFGLLCAIVTGVISSVATGKKTEASIRISQAVTDTKLEELTREVREHNGFARRMPVVEEQIREINRRVADLEAAEK